MHLGVRESELRHCYAAHPDQDKVILWTALCFGLKAAPLLWGRFAAAVARLIQGLFHEDTVRSQVYLDDPVWIALGPAWWRRRAFALIALSVRALGFRIAWKKCERGTALTWVGVQFTFAGTPSSSSWRSPRTESAIWQAKRATSSGSPWLALVDCANSPAASAGSPASCFASDGQSPQSTRS